MGDPELSADFCTTVDGDLLMEARQVWASMRISGRVSGTVVC